MLVLATLACLESTADDLCLEKFSTQRGKITLIIIACCWVLVTLITTCITSLYVWQESRRMLKFNHLFVRDVFSTASGLLENLILTNLKTDPEDNPTNEYAGVAAILNPVNELGKAFPGLTNVMYGNMQERIMARQSHLQEANKAFAGTGRIPYIYVCPTLYRENEK